jgi:hypothetical protein
MSKNPQHKTGIFPFYPILFGVYPVLALMAYNISQIDLFVSYRSIIISAALALVLYSLLGLFMRNWARAALLSLLLLFLFYSYGHIYMLLKNLTVAGINIGRHRTLLILWAGLAGLAAWISTRNSLRLASVTTILNVVSLLMLVFPLYQILEYEGRHYIPKPSDEKTNLINTDPSAPHSAYPDIYYIILDAHGRTDTFKEMYGFDNSKFIQELAQRGFYVAACSQSNYGYTELSLASSFNMNYLDKISNPDLSNLVDVLQYNATRAFLKQRGYTIVAFETGFRWLQWEDADVYYSLQNKISVINNFETLYVETTLLRLFYDYNMGTSLAKIAALHDQTTVLGYNILDHEQVIHTIDTLKKIPNSVPSPKFIYAHLLIPHEPFVFSPTGDYVPDRTTAEGRIAGYRDAVTFIDSAMLDVVDNIIAKSKIPPIIVIQGDHGPQEYTIPYQHMRILNAYYLPGATNLLYPSITPVNTFRVILDSTFGQHLPLLEDASWFSPHSTPHANFTIVPNDCGK